ncbi:alpha-2-macroglobulin-like [Megalops cyprinoides]|uniref:alpha-2-macroglobulin-like n=1 Tax=Megalops cyprinoides TaxID=118141 RepID=UPI0018650DB8|nr:alpha-2-macroglobulin-like [Megalops cyprinoides]
MLGLLLTTCLLLQSAMSRRSNEPIYLVTVTSQTVGGSTETLCAQVHLVKEPLSFVVTLEMEGSSETTLLQESVTTEFHRCVQFQVPPVVTDTVVTIHASVQWGRRCLSKETKILIKPTTYFTIIQTDKPVYKPGQTVQFRVVSLDSSLASYSQVYRTVELQDAERNRIAQWLNQSTTSGILDLSHPTTTEAKQGVYTITTWTEKDEKTTHTFEIIEYVLPKFEVNVHLPDIITALDTEVTVKICGKYTYGKPVLGTVKIVVCCRPESNPRVPYMLPVGICRSEPTTAKTDKTGCATRVISITDFHWAIQEYIGKFIVESEIEEDGTGVVLQGSGSTKFTPNYVFLEFQDAPSTFKRGIDYEGKILAKRALSVPMPNVSIYLYAYYGSNSESKPLILTTDSKGVAHFSLDTSSWGLESAFLEARSSPKVSEVWYGFFQGNTETVHHTVKAFYSKSKSFVKIRQAKGKLPCDEDGRLLVQYIIQEQELSGQKNLDFFFLVLSKGSMVQHGRSTVTLSDGEVKKGELSLTLQQMAELVPYAQVVVYTVLPVGEIVADSSDFPIQLCFRNKVSLQFSSPQQLPGEKTSLELQAQPGSLCSLRAIDQSVLLKKPEEELSAKAVYDRLPFQRLNDYPQQVHDWEAPPCLSRPERTWNRRKRSIHFNPSDVKDDTYRIFKGAGIKALTNLEMKTPVPCHDRMPLVGVGFSNRLGGGGVGLGGVPGPPGIPVVAAAVPNMLSPAVPSVTSVEPPRETIRTFFPETWIWELVPVGDSGSVRVEQTVPDTITKWVANAFCTSSAGFGLAANTGLTAFQPFFLSLTLPYSIIRGEVFTLKATVFNYLSKCIMVQVSLAESAQFTGQPCDGCQYRRCLCGEESDTFSWVLTPTALGEVSIKASAEALSTEDLCGNEVVTVPERGQIDTVVRKLLVEPEGTEQTISHNALLCPKEGAVEKVISLELPEVFVEGSAKAFLSVLGDLMGRAMRNLDGLLAMPYGCGEQNMLRFAPNIFILRYLESTGQLTPEIRAKAVTFLESGYQRELNYKHRDGSYSAFGQSDPSGNTWLTAFVMKSFGGARPYIFIDPEHIASAKTWLSLQQQEDGCIRSVGKLFHNEMKGGVSDEVMLTAYVTAALLELDRNVTDPMVRRSLSCLKLASDQLNSIYATALFSYTFSLAGDHDMKMRLIGQLDRVAKTTGDGRHWEHAEASGIDSLSVEMTSYVLLALLTGPPLTGFDLSYSSTIVRWLAQQQNPYGGFSSTQDTVVALQALTLYGAATFSPGGASTVTVASTGSYKQQFSVDQHNRLLYQEEQLQEVPGVYSIKAEGESCVFVQIALSYNIPPPPDSSSFTITATAAGNCSSTRRPSLVVTVAVRYNGRREETNMVIISVRLLSGFLLDKSSLTPLQADPAVKRVEEEEGHVIIYLDELKRMEPKMYNLIIVEDVPVRNLKPAVVKVYDYYKKSDEAVSEYSSPCAQADEFNQL